MDFRKTSVAMAIGLVAIWSCPAGAQPTCPAATPLTAAANAGGLDASVVKSGNAVQVALRDTAAVTFVAPPEKLGPAGSHGGMVSIAITAPGTYRVGIGSGAWLDVVQDGALIQSSAHSHGEACLVKMVDFPLHAGRAVIEITSSSEAELRLLVSPAP